MPERAIAMLLGSKDGEQHVNVGKPSQTLSAIELYNCREAAPVPLLLSFKFTMHSAGQRMAEIDTSANRSNPHSQTPLLSLLGQKSYWEAMLFS